VIPAVVLAAGLSTRMGGVPKALLSLDTGESFISRIVATFQNAGVDDVVVVLGHEAESVAAALAVDQIRARAVMNARYRSGQFSSVLKGLDAIDRPGVAGMLLTLVDVPLFSPATVRAVLDCFRETGAPIVRPVRGNEHGHPVLIGRALFAAIRAADPAIGLKPIVRANASRAGDISVTDDGAFRDVDTPADYERLRADEGSR
jgi:CTP:molybdopterin cytidylyltransferase MocA